MEGPGLRATGSVCADGNRGNRYSAQQYPGCAGTSATTRPETIDSQRERGYCLLDLLANCGEQCKCRRGSLRWSEPARQQLRVSVLFSAPFCRRGIDCSL